MKLNKRWSDWRDDARVITASGFGAASPAPGEYGKLALDLPAYRRGVYYRAHQKYPIRPLDGDDWINGANRLQAKEFGGQTGFDGLADGGMMMTLELTDGRYMTLLPLVGPKTIAWLAVEGNRLFVRLGSLGTGGGEGDDDLPAPLLSYSIAGSIYAANYEAWRNGLRHPLVGQTARLRSDKRFPDMFRYLGWCSWEELFFTIDEQRILEVIDQIDASPVPIRYFLIDDGHQHHERSGELAGMELNTPTFEGMPRSRLMSFEANERFPRGWSPIIERVRRSKMQGIGLWLNFNGYWGGIHPDHLLGVDEALTSLRDGDHEYLLPKDDYYCAYRFYDAYIAAQRAAGFDFLKIDHQAANLAKYRRGGGEHPVSCAANNARAMETASAYHMQTHINCMAHNAVAMFNTRSSSVTRCSEDYKKGDRLWAKRHVHNSFATIPVLGHTVWGDHDMFHSHDPAAAEVMSVSKALSGGPVYLSDAPERFNRAVIDPLIYADGELLRPLAPAVPLPDSILGDPVTGGDAYAVIAPLAGGAAAIALFNLTEPVVPARRLLSAGDYRWAGAMLQPVEQWAMPAEGVVLYDWNSGDATRMSEETEPVSFALDEFGYRLLLMCPVRHGWAAIGRADKYLSAAAVTIVYSDARQLVIDIREPGSYLIWHIDGQLTCTSGSISRHRESMWLLATDSAGFEKRIAIMRH